MITVSTQDNYAINSDKGIAANSLDLSDGKHFIKRTGNIISKATAATDRIVGVNYTERLFASDNQTVAKDIVEYEPKITDITYTTTITGGTVTADDEGKFYNLSDSETVDGTTESTVPFYVDTSDAGAAVDPVISMQLELVEFKSATLGVFRIINL